MCQLQSGRMIPFNSQKTIKVFINLIKVGILPFFLQWNSATRNFLKDETAKGFTSDLHMIFVPKKKIH